MQWVEHLQNIALSWYIYQLFDHRERRVAIHESLDCFVPRNDEQWSSLLRSSQQLGMSWYIPRLSETREDEVHGVLSQVQQVIQIVFEKWDTALVENLSSEIPCTSHDNSVNVARHRYNRVSALVSSLTLSHQSVAKSLDQDSEFLWFNRGFLNWNRGRVEINN